MIFTAHQPDFLPYLGFWKKMDMADVFGLMIHAQFQKNWYNNRVKIGSDDDWEWATIPVHAHLGQSISEVSLTSAGSARARAVVDRRYPAFGLPSFSGETLAEVTIPLLLWGRDRLRISTDLVVLPRNSGLSASEFLAHQTELNGCDTYLSGPSGALYLDETPFKKRGLKVLYLHPVLTAGVRTVSFLETLTRYGDGWREVSVQSVALDRGDPPGYSSGST